MDTYNFPSRAHVTPASGVDPYLYAVWIRAALVNDSTPGFKIQGLYCQFNHICIS